MRNGFNPAANPLTGRPYFPGTAFRKAVSGKKLELPNSVIPLNGSPEWYARQNNGLTVPHQDVPLGDQLRGSGFIPGSDSVFRLADGTVVDFRTRRIIRTPSSRPGYWGDPDRTIDPSFIGHSPGMHGMPGEVTMEDLINNVDGYRGTALPNGELLEPMDPRSAKYWLKAEEEAEKLKSSMSDEQKRMLADFESHFPKSKLIEESRKI